MNPLSNVTLLSFSLYEFCDKYLEICTEKAGTTVTEKAGFSALFWYHQVLWIIYGLQICFYMYKICDNNF